MKEKYSTRCWLFHDYGKWESFERIISTYHYGVKIQGSEYMQQFQHRVCKKCGHIQERKISW